MEKLTAENFEKEIANGVVLVDFYATWCGPCKMLAPILEQAAEAIGNKAKLFKADVDEVEAIARKFGIMSVPTMIVFKNGQEVDKMVGLRMKKQIVDAIDNCVG